MNRGCTKVLLLRYLDRWFQRCVHLWKKDQEGWFGNGGSAGSAACSAGRDSEGVKKQESLRTQDCTCATHEVLQRTAQCAHIVCCPSCVLAALATLGSAVAMVIMQKFCQGGSVYCIVKQFTGGCTWLYSTLRRVGGARRAHSQR